jgi:glucosamine-phosphate N-acetyltransferase
MKLRSLLLSDYYKNYFSLLKQLTIINEDADTYENYKKIWFKISNNPYHYVKVIEIDDKIVATGTLVLEPKFYHQGTFAGHIEDIVVDKDYREQGLSRQIVDELKDIAEKYECYRITLNCKDDKIGLYNKFEFKKTSNCMRIDYFDPY